MNDRLIKDYRPYLAKLSELSYDREHKVSLIEDEDRVIFLNLKRKVNLM